MSSSLDWTSNQLGSFFSQGVRAQRELDKHLSNKRAQVYLNFLKLNKYLAFRIPWIFNFQQYDQFSFRQPLEIILYSPHWICLQPIKIYIHIETSLPSRIKLPRALFTSLIRASLPLDQFLYHKQQPSYICLVHIWCLSFHRLLSTRHRPEDLSEIKSSKDLASTQNQLTIPITSSQPP